MTSKKRARNRSKRAGAAAERPAAAAAATDNNRPRGQRQPLGQLDLQMQQLKVEDVDDSPPKDGVIKEEDICVHGLIIPYNNEKLRETLSVCDEAAASGNINKIYKLAFGYMPKAEREGRKPLMPMFAKKVRQWMETVAEECGDGDDISTPDDLGILVKVLVMHPELFDDHNHYNNVHTQWIKSHFVSEGTKCLLREDIEAARCYASLTWWFDSLFSFIKIQGDNLDLDLSSLKGMKSVEIGYADKHTLCSFFRKRIPCSCLKKVYKEVKSVTKLRFSMFCSNKGCKRQLTKDMMCCSLCRNVSYCSRKCQKEDWSRHKISCSQMNEMSQNPKEYLADTMELALLQDTKSPGAEAVCDLIKCLREGA